ncbi:MAG TPA: nicotinamide mononucleotide deamidase-related protein [Pyrodictium sp.]|nr:nicotinamide mononucleotide deamidase-related protein [Pyrodictium sp.]
MAKDYIVWIVNIGTELCIGRIVNTNGAWLAQQLTLLGFRVKRIVVVPDEEDVIEILRDGCRRARVIITTGGLGPTEDDRTAEFIAKAFGRSLILNREALELVRRRYERARLTLSDERKKMAMLPEGAKPIPNPIGTAPGIHLDARDCHVFALPGVPREMQAMFEHYVKPLLEEIGPKVCVVEKGYTVEGIPESSLAPILKRIAKVCRECYVKSHPKGDEITNPIIEVRVLASAHDCSEARRKVETVLRELERLLGGVDKNG